MEKTRLSNNYDLDVAQQRPYTLINKINELEKLVLSENRWDTWHVGGVREHLDVLEDID